MEAVGGSGEPMSPLSFQGFRLHTTWTHPPGEELIHRVALPCLLGEENALLIIYESEKFPRDLMQGQKIAVSLQPPAKDHWNIISDRSLPWMLEESQRQCEAQWAAQAPDNKVEGAAAPPIGVPTPGEPPKPEAQGSGKELPSEAAPTREWILEATVGSWNVSTLHLQTMREMGGMQEVDRALTQTLLAEFVRLQLVVSEDFAKSLTALCSDLEASSMTFISDMARTLDLQPDDPMSCQLMAALRKFQQTTSLKAMVPLTELEVAQEGLESFMQRRLQELSSQTESRELIGALSQKLADNMSQVWELAQAPELTVGEASL